MRNTMRMTVLAVGMVLVGCNAESSSRAPIAANVQGPSAIELEKAFQVAWEGAGGMEASVRPRVRWFDDVSCGSPVFDGTVGRVTGACAQVWIDSDGDATVGWHEGLKISETSFVSALAMWRMWLESSTFNGPIATQHAFEDSFTAALRKAGL